MHIPQDVWDLIIDQLAEMEDHGRFLRAASLVSTAWVNRSQHHLFSTVSFKPRVGSVQEWCSGVRPDPGGVSRHVRTLEFIHGRNPSEESGPLVTDVLKTAFSHLTSFRNIQRLGVYRVDLGIAPLDVLIPVISSFAGTLKQLLWIQAHDTAHKTWTTISTIVNLLPNLVDLFLSGDIDDAGPGIACPPLPRIQLPDDLELERFDYRVYKHFKFQELRFSTSVPTSSSFLEYCRNNLRALDLRDMWIIGGERTLIGGGLEETRVLVLTTLLGDYGTLQMLLEACRTLETLAFSFYTDVGRLLRSIPSDSISLIHLYDPRPSTPFRSLEKLRNSSVALFEDYVSELEQIVIPECRNLGVSLKVIARRFCDHHPGLKTRVRIYIEFTDWGMDARPIEYVDIPLLKAELEKEVGDDVTFELARTC